MTTVQDELKLSSDDLIGSSYPGPLCCRRMSVPKLVENRSRSWQDVRPPALQHQGTEDKEKSLASKFRKHHEEKKLCLLPCSAFYPSERWSCREVLKLYDCSSKVNVAQWKMASALVYEHTCAHTGGEGGGRAFQRLKDLCLNRCSRKY